MENPALGVALTGLSQQETDTAATTMATDTCQNLIWLFNPLINWNNSRSNIIAIKAMNKDPARIGSLPIMLITSIGKPVTRATKWRSFNFELITAGTEALRSGLSDTNALLFMVL
jgi:hypothetical protein